MAHELDQAADGTAAFISHRQPAWHGLGTIVEEAPTIADALTLAHLDWQVTLEPVVATLPDGTTLPAERNRATVRTSPWTGEREVLGVVGTGYRPIQNAEALAWVDTLLDTGELRVETAGALRGGRSIFVSTYLPDDYIIDPGGLADPIRQYLLATNSHDGSTSMKGVITPTRVVCANTERVALRNARASVSIQHRTGAAARIDQARQVLGLTTSYVAEWAELATELARVEITQQAWEDFLTGHLVPDAKAGAPEVSKRAVEDKRAAVAAVYVGDTNRAIAGTAWGAFNAWTEYLDHYRPTQDDSGLGTAVVEGTTDKDKTRAWVAVRELAARTQGYSSLAAAGAVV